jgi:hypothetical protein
MEHDAYPLGDLMAVTRLRMAVPVRHERTVAFVTRARGCGLEEVLRPVYAASAMAADLHERRVKASVSLRDAASRAGIRAVEWSGVEQGRLVPESMDDWNAMRKAVES